MEIRFITTGDDRLEISSVYENSWKYAYKDILPQSYLDSLPKGYWAPRIDHPDRKSMIIVEQGKIVGTSSFGRSRFPEFAGWGEIMSLYLLPEYIGKGYGKTLLKAVVRELQKQNYKDIFLWVLEENSRARRFYEKFGFSPAKDRLKDNIGGKDVTDIRYIYTV